MNRDDSRSRGLEYAPSTHSGKTKFIAPIDSEAMGTWFGVNEYGIAAALLNAYDTPPKPSGSTRTRGEIVMYALSLKSIEQIEEWLLTELSPTDYNDFRIVLITREKLKAFHKEDDHIEPIKLFEYKKSYWLTSSSVRRDEVLPFRQEKFKQWARNGFALRKGFAAYHFETDQKAPELSVNAIREETHTKSITQACFSNRAIEISYVSLSHLESEAVPTVQILQNKF